MDFINTVTLEGVVIEEPASVVNGGITKQAVVVWTHLNGAEFIFRAVASSRMANERIKDLTKGSICSFSGSILILKYKESKAAPLLPVLAISSFRELDVDPKYGIEMLKEAQMSEYLNEPKLKLPWD